MKKFILFVIMLCLAINTVNAESMDFSKEEGLLEAAEQTQIWIDKLRARSESIQDEDSRFVVESILDSLLIMKSVMVNSAIDTSTNTVEIETDGVLHNGYTRYVSDTDKGKLTKIETDFYTSDSGRIYLCETEYTPYYQSLCLYVFDAMENLISKQQIEMADKESESLLVMLNYNAQDQSGKLDTVGKFATWLRASDEVAIYTLVFGSDTNIALKPKKWIDGELSIAEWDTDLLLPDTAKN